MVQNPPPPKKKLHPGSVHPKRQKGRTSVTFLKVTACRETKTTGLKLPAPGSSRQLLDQCPTGQHRRGGVRPRQALHLLLREPALPRQLGQAAGILRASNDGCTMAY